jgi:hypothetical protein
MGVLGSHAHLRRDSAVRKPPEGYETDGLSLLSYLKGGKAPERDSFYWELHESGQPIQAARFGNWKAVRNGTDKPIEIYDLGADAGESSMIWQLQTRNSSRGGKIFAESHRPDPRWPLDRLSEALKESREAAWKVKRERDRTRWVPENAKPLARREHLLPGVHSEPMQTLIPGLIFGKFRKYACSPKSLR